MKIVLFNTFYHPKFVGGAEISVQLLAEALVRMGHQVYVVTIGKRKEIARLNGVIIFRLLSKNISSVYDDKRHNPLATILWLLLDSFNPFYRYSITRFLKRVNPDVVHTNNIMGFSPAIWATIKRLQIPLIHTIRDYYLLCYKCNMFDGRNNCDRLCNGCKIMHNVKKTFLNKPDSFVGVSDFTLKRHQDFSCFDRSKKLSVIYNAIDLPQISYQKKADSKLVIGYMGRLSRDKGVEYLIEEIRTLTNKYSPHSFEILFAGKGEDHYVEYLMEQLNGISYRFLGKVEPREFYKKVDLTIVPSLWNEPFGRVVIESLSYGVPVCMSARGGLIELHQEQVSWLFRQDDDEENSLSAILIDILNDRTLLYKKSQKAREYASKFTVQRNVEQYMALYLQLKN